MLNVVNLGRAKIYDYLICSRRFQLRYVEQLPWPIVRQDAKGERSRRLGQQFHTILHRHFLGIPLNIEELAEPDLARWWQQFRLFESRIPPGLKKPELTLTVPIGGLSLTGRFDLLVDTGDGIHIFDWKTNSRAKSTEQLRQDLQSKIYLALVAESGDVLGRTIRPEEIILTYWFVTDPPVEVSIVYGRREHAENWSYLKFIAGDVEERLASQDSWPLIDALDECARCAYQIPCGRVQTGRTPGDLDLAGWGDQEEDAPIEPVMP